MTYKNKASRTNTRWTDEERERLRTLHQQGESSWDIARILDRSHGAITQKIYWMRRQDAAEGYVHVAGDTTEIMPSLNTPVRVTVTAPDPAPALTDAMLEEFNLYVADPPSLWQRVMQWLKK